MPGVGPMSGIQGEEVGPQCIMSNDHMGNPPNTNRMTDTCENITFPQLRFRSVKTPYDSTLYTQFKSSLKSYVISLTTTAVCLKYKRPSNSFSHSLCCIHTDRPISDQRSTCG